MYKAIELSLKANRNVLFSGTPCQIAGLNSYLRKEYNTLFTVDFICHGVPSPKVFGRYLKDICNNTQVENIKFRDKINGWTNYSFTLTQKNGDTLVQEETLQNPFLKGFILNLYLRPSCHHCRFKNFSSGSDITLADAWGIHNYIPHWNDNKGVSLVIPNSSKGSIALSEIQKNGVIDWVEVDKEIIKKHNPSAYISAKQHKSRKKFFKLLNQQKLDFKSIINICLPPPTYCDKIIWSINKRIKKYVK